MNGWKDAAIYFCTIENSEGVPVGKIRGTIYNSSAHWWVAEVETRIDGHEYNMWQLQVGIDSKESAMKAVKKSINDYSKYCKLWYPSRRVKK